MEVGLYQTKTIRHRKGNNKQSKETTHRKHYIFYEGLICRIYKELKNSIANKKNSKIIDINESSIHISQKKTLQWSTALGKSTQHH
jgi:hypothetical protein